MKAYIIKIVLQGSEPFIWRRFIMPAGATFRRLHDVIQGVTNFKDYHLYEFDLRQENLVVTNNEEAYLEHKHFLKNKKQIEKQIESLPPEDKEFEMLRFKNMSNTVRQPQTIKVDDYVEKYDQIRYRYDFGDSWEFTIQLEEIVHDYYFGFPILLEGEETAPPEDAGGMYGFYQFLEIYQNKKHPDHKEMMLWAEDQGFRAYDPERINDIIKYIKYKKTEWNKINHENYAVVEDKYHRTGY